MRASRGEIKIEEVLQKAGLNFEEEYEFPGLISSSGKPLRFDFCVFDDNEDIQFLIEFQGIQHYMPKSKFGGVSGFKRQQYNDLQKRKFCEKNGLILIAIPYTDESFINYDYIMNAYYSLGGF